MAAFNKFVLYLTDEQSRDKPSRSLLFSVVKNVYKSCTRVLYEHQ